MKPANLAILLFLLTISSSLSGQQVSPASLTFESVPPNTTPEQTLTFYNTGDTMLSLSSFTVAPPFAIADKRCPARLGAGKHCLIYLTYTAQDIGEQDNADLVITYSGGSTSVPLSGSGVSYIATSFWQTWNNHPQIRLGNTVYVYATLLLADSSYYKRGCGEQVAWTCSNGQGGTGTTSGNLSVVAGGLCHGTEQGFKGSCLKAEGSFAPDQKGSWTCTLPYPGDGVCGPSTGSDSFSVF